MAERNAMILVDDIRGALSRKACIVGVGNTLLGDDGAGVVLVEALRCGGAGARVRLVNAEDIIESHAFEIAEGDWDTVVVVDAVRFGGSPGDVMFGAFSETGDLLNDFSTHKLSLRLSESIWRRSGKETFLLGIEPGNVDFGEGLSEAVRKSAETLGGILLEAVKQHPEGACV
ncbi:MAG: hydrogenase maturation protease [Spirochaetes bacterium]|nr:hydrogenase maturation protease [Spirochaetota bacterium]